MTLIRGQAIEWGIHAEDPERSFAPKRGRVDSSALPEVRWKWARHDGVAHILRTLELHLDVIATCKPLTTSI